MTDINQLTERYIAAWTGDGTAGDRELIARLYASDAYYANAGNDYRGLAGIELAISRNRDKFLSRGFVFKATDDAVTHHGSARLSWQMLAPDGETVAAGTQFVVLDDDGRVRADYQFLTLAPPA